jgi:phage terminase large subunit GpA-like protein
MITTDLFAFGLSQAHQRKLDASPEHSFLVNIALGHFKPRSKEPIWQWADREVWLDQKQTAKAGRYDSRKTPWAREIQDIPRDPDCSHVREVAIKKPSRCGITEGVLNVVRWMPEHWPGNVLYAINSQKKAREVAKKRIIPGIESTAKGQLTDDPNDKTLSTITLKNMEIIVSGSGADGAFMEAWYRLVILDELSRHIHNQGTTTEQRAKSRQSDVDDGVVYKISKPEEAGDAIDLAYIRGDQRKYLVPCPRCERRIELTRHGVVYSHCRQMDGTWDLDAVVRDSYRLCPYCQGRIDEHEKYAMVNSDLARWTPTEPALRRKSPEGTYVPIDPALRSYHLGDWYSLHDRLTTGELMKLYLMAYEIEPSESSKFYFTTNHEGESYENNDHKIDSDSIDALQGGRVEQREITNGDGTKETRIEVLGVKFFRAYIDGEFKSRLPFRPALIAVKADKQKDRIKAMVYAWMANGDRYLIDVCYFQDEDAFIALHARPYWIEKEYLVDPDDDQPMFVLSGLIDSRYRPTEVYAACIKAHHDHGWQVWPVKGEGKHEEYQGKMYRLVVDKCESEDITVRYFYDYEIKNNFYITRIQKRSSPRLWLPDDLPKAVYSEWMAETYNETTKEWEHDPKRGPNDFGDCGKYCELFWQENKLELKNLPCAYPRPAS